MPRYELVVRLYDSLLDMHPGDLAHRFFELATLAFTGARLSEALVLELRDIGADWNTVSEVPVGNIRITSSKRKGHVRFVPVPRVWLDAARVYVVKRALTYPDSKLFSVSHATLRSRVEKQSEELLDVCLPPHALRHAFAIYMLSQKRVDPVRLAYWLGHAKTSTTLEIYSRYIPPPRESPW